MPLLINWYKSGRILKWWDKWSCCWIPKNIWATLWIIPLCKPFFIVSHCDIKIGTFWTWRQRAFPCELCILIISVYSAVFSRSLGIGHASCHIFYEATITEWTTKVWIAASCTRCKCLGKGSLPWNFQDTQV